HEDRRPEPRVWGVGDVPAWLTEGAGHVAISQKILGERGQSWPSSRDLGGDRDVAGDGGRDQVSEGIDDRQAIAMTVVLLGSGLGRAAELSRQAPEARARRFSERLRSCH